MNIERTIREYIEKSLHMSLATTSGEQPWVCELHFVYDDDLNIYWRSLPTRRHSQELKMNPRVSGNIVAQHSLEDLAHGIYFEGLAELVTDQKEIEHIFPLFHKRLGSKESIVAEAQTEEGHKFYKITVKTWYAFGSFDGNDPQKYSLAWK